MGDLDPAVGSPARDEPPARELDPRIVRVWTLSALGVTLPAVVVGLLFGVALRHPLSWSVFVLALLATGIAAGWAPRARYRVFRWGIDQGVLRIRDGIVVHTEASVPVFRIQHIDLTQGPLERWAGVQQLVVHTAAPAADVELPGIAATDASRLRAELLELARRAVAEHGAGEAADAV